MELFFRFRNANEFTKLVADRCESRPPTARDHIGSRYHSRWKRIENLSGEVVKGPHEARPLCKASAESVARVAAEQLIRTVRRQSYLDVLPSQSRHHQGRHERAVPDRLVRYFPYLSRGIDHGLRRNGEFRVFGAKHLG